MLFELGILTFAFVWLAALSIAAAVCIWEHL
jgi:hypothetical protein